MHQPKPTSINCCFLLAAVSLSLTVEMGTAEARTYFVTHRGSGANGLKWAVDKANAHPGVDDVVIMFQNGIGVYSIRPKRQIHITESVNIYGDPTYAAANTWTIDTIQIDSGIVPQLPESLFVIGNGSTQVDVTISGSFVIKYVTPVEPVGAGSVMRAFETSGPAHLQLVDGTIRDFPRSNGSVLYSKYQGSSLFERCNLHDNGGADPASFGGAIRAESSVVWLIDSELSNNQAGRGGGVAGLSADIIVEGSTFYQNFASNEGGGVYLNGGSGDITNSTFSENGADYGGQFAVVESAQLVATHVTAYAGDAIGGGSLLLGWAPASADFYNSLVFGNPERSNCELLQVGVISNKPYGYTVLASDSTCGGLMDTVVDDSELHLTSLLNHGGFARTHAIDANSVMYEAADDAHCPSTDQRGVSRTLTCDIGSLEKSQ